MSSSRVTPLVQYRYDSLDRLVDCAVAGQPVQQRFYHNNRLASEIHGQVRHAYFQSHDLLLAQQRHLGKVRDTTLLGTDRQRSVLHVVGQARQSVIGYSPYGFRVVRRGSMSVPGFNGECADPVTGHYLLGNGHRLYNPVLMRFHSPDSWSPFGAGQHNAYAYCGGDPVGRVDPSGHVFKVLPALLVLSAIGFSVGAAFTKGKTSDSLYVAAGVSFLSGGLLLGAEGLRALRMRWRNRNGGSFVTGTNARSSHLPRDWHTPPPSYEETVLDSSGLPSYDDAIRNAPVSAPPPSIELTVFNSPARGSLALEGEVQSRQQDIRQAGGRP